MTRLKEDIVIGEQKNETIRLTIEIWTARRFDGVRISLSLINDITIRPFRMREGITINKIYIGIVRPRIIRAAVESILIAPQMIKHNLDGYFIRSLQLTM